MTLRAFRRRLALPALVLCFLLSLPALAGEDVGGSKDHPLLTRFPDSYIADYRQGYEATEFKVGAKGEEPATETVEGDTTTLRYFHNDPANQPSPLQVIRNYQNALKAIGGEVVYERLPGDGDGGETTIQVHVSGKDVWVRVVPEIFSSPTQSYQLVVTEVEAMAQVISANELLDEIDRNGFITLYLNFDTGKYAIKPGDQPTLAEVATMMKNRPSLTIAVEGHTDNVGDAASNKTLSENRAKAVRDALVAAGIAGDRLTAAGFGAERPVADNRSEDGRAKNRRVELVKAD